MIPPCRFYEMHPDGEQYVGWCGHPDEHGQACIWFNAMNARGQRRRSMTHNDFLFPLTAGWAARGVGQKVRGDVQAAGEHGL